MQPALLNSAAAAVSRPRILAHGPCGTLAVLMALFASATVQAATVAYYRFESGQELTDSSGNGHTLTTTGAASTPTSLAIPGSGDGSAFSNPIPQTGAANGSLASFDGGDFYRAADDAAFFSTTFTIESYINLASTNTSQKSIAGQWNSTGNQRSYLFAVDGGNRLNLLYSTSGLNTVVVASAILPALELDTDYYVAVSVNMANLSTSGITFYLKDLTANGDLLSEGVTHGSTTFFNSSASFTIGSTDQPSSQLTGYLDEVRFSNTKLAISDLLIVPEPGLASLCTLGLTFLALRRRRPDRGPICRGLA